jgi:hypothetical protein
MAATTGGEVTFAISTVDNISGQYYVDMTLCARQCTDSRVEYTLNRANAGEGSDAINDPYERIAYQNDVEIRSTSSCFRPDAVAFQ